MKTTAIFLATLSTAFGVAIEERTSLPQCKTYTDTYDDLNAAVVPLLSPIGTYHGLNYGAFIVAQPVAGTGGVTPQSSPNVAAATMRTDLLQLGSVTLNPFGTLTPASGTKAFNLYSFYFACVINLDNAVVTTAEGCTIAVTGYYTTGKQAPEVTFAYAPTTTENAPMNLAVLPATYIGLQNVTFGIANGATVTANTVLDIDNLVHCNYS